MNTIFLPALWIGLLFHSAVADRSVNWKIEPAPDAWMLGVYQESISESMPQHWVAAYLNRAENGVARIEDFIIESTERPQVDQINGIWTITFNLAPESTSTK